MSRELQRRLVKVETKRHAERGLHKRIERMTDEELTAAIRACNNQLEAEHGPDWREWLAKSDPQAHHALVQLEREGVEL
ncbi:hypothetical protein [Bosea sp. (in: a-proteobacteria)]|jgi:hypothetical protein|uniref:hypothetical protein n=1 Tax=Bosea sp. (in: a-proteobacteria) TaxID=1871050 RepID=UPI002DDD75E0|nr:hypothetical protein [Bosea sp. (in: a-proteobacteria)]HEV2508628.1 hypothetical protein [Bosea sp. (in: a-proteobacteria)]